MTAYYNEIDPFAAQWLRNLIEAKQIAPGEVDERSISDVKPSELAGYTQCHFFAGIGGWSYALRLAGWPDDRPVWTGSCPCQPFSVAGKGGGTDDERHLWPDWFHLIRVVRPPVIFGEQVEAAVKYGWLDLVQDDLEGERYAFAPVVIPAGGVGAPHIRQRIWFVGHDKGAGQQARGSHGLRVESGHQQGLATRSGESSVSRMADSAEEGLEGRERVSERPYKFSPWSPGMVDWLPCRDGKWRPVEPFSFPLANGVSNRVGLLRGYGNAIVPQVAQEVIEAYMDWCNE